MTLLKDASKVYVGTQTVTAIYAGTNKAWPVTAWTPASLPGLTVWLDASQLALADGAAVSPWPNLAAGGVAGTMIGTPAPKISTNKLKGQRLVRFTVSEGRLRMSGTGVRFDYTVAYVGRMLSGGFQGRVLTTDYPGVDGNNNWLLGFHTNGYDWMYDNGNVSPGYKAWDANGYVWKLYAGDGSTTDSRFFIDGVPNGTKTVPVGLGGCLYLSGYHGADSQETCDCEIAELVLYNSRLADADRQLVEGYLRSKWLT